MDPQVTASRLHDQVNSYLADFAGKSAPFRDVLEPDHKLNPELDEITQKLWDGQAHINHLSRGYKLAPYAPPAMLFKYIVHRVNNLDGYNTPTGAHELDHAFFKRNSTGGAYAHHTKLTPHHLNEWIRLNPHVVSEALHGRDNLQQMVKRGIGLNVKTINGEPHVAVTRGLDTRNVDNNHTLVSFADMPDAGFGVHQHNIWVPVSDLWFGFPTTHAYPRGMHGHEHEWLFAQHRPRYEASPGDVKTSWAALLNPFHFHEEGNIRPGQIPVLPYDDISDEYVDADAGALPLNQLSMLHLTGRMGPNAYAEYRRRGGMPQTVSDLSFMPAKEAAALADHQLDMGDNAILAFHNPNLTSGDLVNIVLHPNFIPEKDLGTEKFGNYLAAIARHPNFNTDVADKLMGRIEEGDLHDHAILLARHSPVPVQGLHRYFLGALNAGDSVSWSPEWAIARAFNDSEARDPANVPAAFNNSANTDRYLRALEHYYSTNPDEADGASDVYQTMLTGARMSESLVSNLVNLQKASQPLPGVEPADYDDLIEKIAQENPQLSTRAMLPLTKSPSGRIGLLNRDSLPEGIQLAIADEADDDDQVFGLINRKDLAPAAADKLLFQAQNLDGQTVDEEDLSWLGKRIALNEAVPLNMLEKHLTQEAKSVVSKYDNKKDVPPHEWAFLNPLEQGIVDGIFKRKDRMGEHTVLPLPAGALS